MERLLIIGFVLGIICMFWMHYTTKKYHTKDKFVWMILVLFIPVPAVLIFYFTQMRNKKLV